MTSALDLLMDSDSTAETTTLLESNGICTIDSRTRTIFVPPEIVVGAVQSDKNAERIKFSCPKIVGDNLDLSKFSIRINFENVSSVDPDISIKDQYICEDASINGDNITFSWVIGKNAARYMGTIRFIVCAVKTDSDSNISIEWNTTVAQIPVLEGIEVDQPSLDENNKDIINQLLAITKTASDEAVKNVNSAKEQAITDIQNVLQPDKTLTVEGGIADAKATGNAISSLREDLVDICKLQKPLSEKEVSNYTGYALSLGTSIKNHLYLLISDVYLNTTSQEIRNLYKGTSWLQSIITTTNRYMIIKADNDGELRFNCDSTYNGNIIVYDVTETKLLKYLLANINKLNYVIEKGVISDLGLVSSSKVYCIGDSLTMGAITAGEHAWEKGYSYPIELGKRLGSSFEVINLGVGGEGTETINARITGFIATSTNPQTVPLEIPSEPKKIEILLKAYNNHDIKPFLQEENTITFGSSYGINPCKLGEIEGNITLEDNKYYFERSKIGGSRTISYDQFVSTNAYESINKDDTLIFWCGQNDLYAGVTGAQLSDIECVLNRIDNMIDTLNVDRYIVIGNISEEENPVANENAVKLNKLQSEKYGSHFIDAKYLLINYGLQSMGITPTEQDKTDIADNRVPTSLRSDNIHLNAKGYSYISKIVYQKGASLKYWYN